MDAVWAGRGAGVHCFTAEGQHGRALTRVLIDRAAALRTMNLTDTEYEQRPTARRVIVVQSRKLPRRRR